MFGLLGGLGSIASLLGGVAPAVASYFASTKNVEAQEFAAMSAEERDEFVATQKAWSDMNASRTQNNRTRSAQIMVYLFGVPPAIHWGATFLTATFPALGIHTDPLHGFYAEAEEKIALSFFILAPAQAVIGSLATRLRG